MNEGLYWMKLLLKQTGQTDISDDYQKIISFRSYHKTMYALYYAELSLTDMYIM